MNNVTKNKKKILFVTYGGGHVDIVIRLVKALQKSDEFDCSILGLTIAGKALAKENIDFKGCKDYLFLSDYINSKTIGDSLADKFWSDTSSVSYEETSAYFGVSMHDLIAKKGKCDAYLSYDEMGRKVFCPVDFLSDVLRYEKADIVITTCYVRMEKAAVIAAKNIGIVSLLIDDLLGFSMLGGDLYAGKLIASPDKLPDNICVLNQEVKQYLVHAGMSKDRIHVTGQPVFSAWNEEYKDIHIPQSLQLKKINNKKLVTYISTGCKSMLIQHVLKIIATAKITPEMAWVIKLHPSFTLAEFRKQFNSLPENLEVIADMDVLVLSKASDVLIIHTSTVGLMSLFFSIPLVVLDDDAHNKKGIPYVASGAGLQVTSDDDLKAAIESKLTSDCPSIRAPPLFYNTPDATRNIEKTISMLLYNNLSDISV